MTVNRSAVIGVSIVAVIGFLAMVHFASAVQTRGGGISLAEPNRPSIPEVPAQNEREAAGSQVPKMPTEAATPRAEGEKSDCEHLAQDNPLRLKSNGQRLPLDYSGLQKNVERSLLTMSKVVPLSDGRLLVGLGDTLYMLDRRKRVRWTNTPSWILWDFVVVESSGLIYGGAGDGVLFILDASTGKTLHCQGQNGRANYAQVVRYRKDIALIINSLAGYREAFGWESGKTEMIMADELTAWRGTEALWSLEFPPDAELVVEGDRILAVTKTDKGIYVREIIPPKTAKPE